MKTIFYSWQSDLRSEINKQFIEDTIQNAILQINETIKVQNSPRSQDCELKLDRDTIDIPGSPPIVDTIFKKIDECSIFVADLTFVAKTRIKARTNKYKLVPNPNVLIEYGYACKSKGYLKIIGIMNTAYGEPSEENLPFNIRYLRNPIQYELKSYSNDECVINVKQMLASKLIPEFKNILDKESKNRPRAGVW